MKVLSIGNSFSADAHAYLHELSLARGFDLTTINLAIGGCSLETHFNNIKNNSASYLYSSNGGDWYPSLVTVEEIISSDNFDIVTVQQVSHFSGMYETFQPYLDEIVSYIKKHQPNARLYFHRTWAYEINSDHFGFANYGNDQKAMFEKIISASNRAILDTGAALIPSGDVIQAMREQLKEFDYAHGGASLCCDGFHMSHTYGRYAVALTWLATLTSTPVTPAPFKDLDITIISKICNIINKTVFN